MGSDCASIYVMTPDHDRQAKLTGARLVELLGSSQPVDGLMEEGGNGGEENAALYLAPGACMSCLVFVCVIVGARPAHMQTAPHQHAYAHRVLDDDDDDDGGGGAGGG